MLAKKWALQVEIPSPPPPFHKMSFFDKFNHIEVAEFVLIAPRSRIHDMISYFDYTIDSAIDGSI
jgi:hypothetical protein